MQLRSYMWMLTQSEELAVVGELVLVSVRSGLRQRLSVSYDAHFESFLRERIRTIISDLCAEEERLAQRRRQVADVHFPFGGYRLGQAELERLSERALLSGASLLASAPPGLGKTAAALAGALACRARLRQTGLLRDLADQSAGERCSDV